MQKNILLLAIIFTYNFCAACQLPQPVAAASSSSTQSAIEKSLLEQLQKAQDEEKEFKKNNSKPLLGMLNNRFSPYVKDRLSPKDLDEGVEAEQKLCLLTQKIRHIKDLMKEKGIETPRSPSPDLYETTALAGPLIDKE